MTAGRPIKIAVLADSSAAVKSMRQFADGVQNNMVAANTSVTTGVQKMKESNDRLRESTEHAREGFDRVDTGAMGFRDSVTGMQDATALFRGEADNLGESLLLAGFAAGDLASGFVNFIIPAAASALGWIKNLTVVQRILNITMLSNPVFLVVAAIVALIAIIVIAYQRSETFRNAINAVWSTMRAAWGAIPGFVSGIVSRIIGFFSGIRSRITGFFSGARSWLTNAGREVIQGFLDALTAGFRRVQDALGRLTGMLPDWKGPRERDLRILRPAGQNVIEGFQTGLEDQYGAVERSLSRWSSGLGGTVDTGQLAGGTGAAAAGGERLVLELAAGRSGDQLLDVLWDLLRKRVRVRGRGNVQVALGR